MKFRRATAALIALLFAVPLTASANACADPIAPAADPSPCATVPEADPAAASDLATVLSVVASTAPVAIAGAFRAASSEAPSAVAEAIDAAAHQARAVLTAAQTAIEQAQAAAAPSAAPPAAACADAEEHADLLPAEEAIEPERPAIAGEAANAGQLAYLLATEDAAGALTELPVLIAESIRVATAEGGDHVRKIVINRGSGSFLGVGVADVDADRAKALGLKDVYGVEVTNVVENSAAAKAGIQKGDVILEYNGQRVEGTAQFVRTVRETPAGRSVKLLTSRDGKTQTVTATVGKREPQVLHFEGGEDGEDTDIELAEPPEPPEPFEAPEPPEPPDALWKSGHETFTFTMPDIVIPDIPTPSLSWRTSRLGVETEALGSQLAEFFGVKEGILVRSVLKGSPAEKAGLKAGDVITKLGGQTVSRPGEISSLLRPKKAGDEVPVTIVRSGKERVVNVKIEESGSIEGTPQPLPRKRVIRIKGSGDEL